MHPPPAGSDPFNFLPFRHPGNPSLIFRRSPENGIWVGENVEPQRPKTGPNPLRSARTYLTYSEVYGEAPDRSDVVRRLRRYDLGTILNGIGQISSAMHHAHGEEVLNVQLQLINEVFDRHHQDVGEAFVSRVRKVLEIDMETAVSPVVVFHELQLANLARLAILEVPLDHKRECEDLEDLALATLMMNDLLTPEGSVGRPVPHPESEEDRRSWERFLFVNGMFYHDPQSVTELARTWDLYLTDRPHLKEESEVYHDFPSLIEKWTRLEPMQLWAWLFAVYGRWGKGPDKSSGELPAPVERSSYFTDNYDFDRKDEEAFWELVAAPSEQLREEFEASDPSKPFNPYDLVPLEAHPVVQIGDYLFCPSVLLMKRRMTTGLHHILLNRVDNRALYLNYMGEVFEDYLNEVLASAFKHPGGRLITEKEMNSVAPDASVCDAIIDYGDSVLLLEVKSRRANLGVRVWGDLGELDAMLDHVFMRPARQIDSVIKLIRQGELSVLGLLPGQVHAYVPVSVTLDSIPMNPLTYRRLSVRLAEEGVLQGPSTVPLQLLSAADVEALEMAVQKGHSARDLLVGRVLENNHEWAGLLNHLHSLAPDLMGETPPRLGEQFGQLSQQAVEYFRAHERTPEDAASESGAAAVPGSDGSHSSDC